MNARGCDAQAEGWRVFLLRWHQVHGERRLTARQVWESTELDIGQNPWDGTFPFPTGRCPAVSLGTAPVKSLGRWLAGQTDRWRGDLVLRSALQPGRKGRAYWVHHRSVTTGPVLATSQTTDRPGVSDLVPIGGRSTLDHPREQHESTTDRGSIDPRSTPGRATAG